MTGPRAEPAARRVDARRNRDALVAAASQVFADAGVDAPLDSIARRAGVGNATMYRNFPTRDDLLMAVLADRYEALAAQADDDARASSPEAGLSAWLTAFVGYLQTYRDLPEPVLATLREHDSALYQSCEAMRAAAGRLLTRAQDAGVVRADINATDLFTHAAGIAWAAQRTPDDPRRTARLLSVMLDGLRKTQGSDDDSDCHARRPR